MIKVSTFLWYDSQAKEAAEFYTSVVRNSRVTGVTNGPDGSVMVVTFELDGQQFVALNAGPIYTFNEAISIYLDCESQDEVDQLWAALTEGGGEPGPCG